MIMPLCVDLDGTLIRNDVTAWSVESFVRRGFWNVFRLLFWVLSKGWAHAKRRIAQEVPLDDMSLLQYNKGFLDYLISQSRAGVHLFLATGSDEIYAKKVSEHLGIFDGVFASNGEVSLSGKTKADALCMIFGERGFVYAGNSGDDVAVWARSAAAILVNPRKAALEGIRKMTPFGDNYMLFD